MVHWRGAQSLPQRPRPGAPNLFRRRWSLPSRAALTILVAGGLLLALWFATRPWP